MKTRIASLFLAVACTVPACLAQNPPGPPEGAGATILSLANDLAALAARVAKLEGQIVAADLAGTYAIRGIENELRSHNNGAAPQVASYVFVGTATLAADGTGSLTAAARGNKLLLGPPPFVSPFNAADASAFTWTYTGGVVTVSFGGEDLHLSAAAGGRVLVGTMANQTDGTDVLLILTRLQ